MKSNSSLMHEKEKLIKTINELLKTGTQHRTHQKFKTNYLKASWWNFWDSQGKKINVYLKRKRLGYIMDNNSMVNYVFVHLYFFLIIFQMMYLKYLDAAILYFSLTQSEFN